MKVVPIEGSEAHHEEVIPHHTSTRNGFRRYYTILLGSGAQSLENWSMSHFLTEKSKFSSEIQKQ